MRRNPWFVAVVIATVAMFGSLWGAEVALASNQTHTTKHRSTLAGTWSGSYGGAFSGTFTLRWTLKGSSLHGTIALSKPKGTYGISGSVKGGAIKFGAVGVGAVYTGKVSGKTMSGQYATPRGGGPWRAHKTS